MLKAMGLGNFFNKMKWKILSKKAELDIKGILIDIALLISLIPVVVTFIASSSGQECPSGYENLTGSTCQLITNHSVTASAVATGLSTTEATLLGLTTLFLVIGLVFAIGRQSGLIKGKN